MKPEEFRRWGREVVDWIANYMERVEQYPVVAQVKPGEIRAQLPAGPPLAGRAVRRHPPRRGRDHPAGHHPLAVAQLLRLFPVATIPARRSWASCSRPGLGVQGMLWATSPACTELETHVLDWMVDMLGLPPHFKSTSTGGGVIQDSASSAAPVRDPGRPRAGHRRPEQPRPARTAR